MLRYQQFVEAVEKFTKRLGRVDAVRIAHQRAAATKKHHYARETPDGWEVHEQMPNAKFSTNRIIRVDHRGKQKDV